MAWMIVFILGVTGAAALLSLSSRLRQMERHVGSLQEQISIMQRTLGGLVRTTSGPPAPSPGPAPAPEEPQPAQSYQEQLTLRQAGAMASAGMPMPQPRPMAPPPQVRPSRTQQELEALIGEKLLNRVGAVALIIGVAFFLKYAFDRDWISPVVRVLMGVVLGSALVVMASRQRDKLPIFAQGILGAGLGILYLSAYASFGFYHLIGQTAAFVAMSAVTLVTLERGRRFGSLAVALIGWFGGSITPLVLSSGAGSGGIGLFVYLILFNIALVGLASAERRWWVLQPLALVSTYANFFGWFRTNRGEEVAAASVFIVGVWLIFHAADVWQEARRGDPRPAPHTIAASLNAALSFGAIAAVLDGAGSNSLKLYAVAATVAYSLPGVFLRRSVSRHSLKAMLFLMTATALQFEDFTTVELWAVECLLVLSIAMKTKQPDLHLIGLGGFAFTTASLFVTPHALDRSTSLVEEAFLFNARGAAFLIVAGCAAAGVLSYRLHREPDAFPEARYGKALLNYAWTFLLFCLMTVEILDYFDRRLAATSIPGDQNDYATGLILAAVWVSYGLIITLLGTRASSESILHPGVVALSVGLMATALFAVSYVPIQRFQPVMNLRSAVVMMSIAAAYATSIMLGKSGWQRTVSVGLGVAIALMSFELLTAETRDLFQREIAVSGEGIVPGGSTLSLRYQQQLAISAAWLLYSAVTMTVGIARRLRGFRIAAICLMLLTVLKVFLFDLSFLTELYRIVSFIALGVILLGASFAYQKYKTTIFGEAPEAG